MDIGSLLQDAPSRGRTERERQQKSLQNTTSASSAAANKPISSINDPQNDPRPRSSSFAINAHLPPHPPLPMPTSDYARPTSATNLRDSPNLNPTNNISSPSSSAASSSYYHATHAEMERVRQLPVIPPQPLGYHHDVPSQQQQQQNANEQATTAAAATATVPATTVVNSAAAPTNSAANPASSVSASASASAGESHGAQPLSQNHYLHRNNNSLSSSAAAAPGDVFPPFAASARHQPQPRDPPQPTPTAPVTTTTTRDGQNASRHTHHASLSHASHHQFNPRDPPPAQTTRPGSSRDTTMSYGQQTMKQQQQHSDRRSRRDSVGSGYPTMIQTDAPHPIDYQMNDYRERELHPSKYAQSQPSSTRIHAPVPKPPPPPPPQVQQPTPASTTYLPIYTNTPESHPSLSRRYDPPERPLPPPSGAQPAHPQHPQSQSQSHVPQLTHPHPDSLPLPLQPAPQPQPPSQAAPVKLEKKPPVLPPPPRTPSPKLPPAHLGSFVYPSLPFPIAPRTLPLNRRTTLAVVVPNAFLPTSLRHTNAGRVWGGVSERERERDGGAFVVSVAGRGAGAGRGGGRSNDEFTNAFGVHIPAVPAPLITLAATTTAAPAAGRGRAGAGGKEIVVGGDERRFYTDDSDVVFAALHAGALEWDKVKEWRRVEVVGADARVRIEGSGEDVEIVLRVYPHTPTGRFYGGPGANGLVSSSWGWSHEGCAYEILSVSPLSRGTARAHGRQTRKTRMREYAALRASVMDSPPHSPPHTRTHTHLHQHPLGSSDWSGSSSSPKSDASPPPASVSGSGSASTTPESEEFMLKTNALRSTTTTTKDETPTTRDKEKKQEKEKELSNLFKASTSKIGSELDLALETGRVEVSLERSVREERFAHVRLVGGWSCGGRSGGNALGRSGGAAGGRMGFKYDPRALREAVFGGAAGRVKRRKVEGAEEGGVHTKDREKGREDVVLLAEGGASERVVFVYRGVRPLQTTIEKDESAANPTPAIGTKRPREEEQDDEYGAVYDVFRERRVGDRKDEATSSASSTAAPATGATTTASATSEGTTKGVRFAEGSKVADGGSKPHRRRRLKAGTGSTGGGGGDGKVVWRRTLIMRNVCESDVDFGRDGVSLWVKVAPSTAKITSSTSTTTTSTSIMSPATFTATFTATPTATTTATTTTAVGTEEPLLTRLKVEYDGKTRTAGTKDERRGVVFPCKVWRWRPPPRITHIRVQKEVEGEEKKMEVDG